MASYPKNIKLLLSLDDVECKKFKAYLKSPLFNLNKKLLPLYELIVKDFKEKEKIYSEPDFIRKAYGAQKTSQYKSHLQEFGKHFKQFVALQYFEKRSLLCNQLVLADHLRRESGAFFTKQYEQTQKEFNKLPLDLNQYQNKYEIEELLDTYIKYYKDDRVGDTNLQVLSDTIDRDFILKKLCCTVVMLSRSKITKVKYNLGLMPLLLDALKDTTLFDDLLIKLFYYAYEILASKQKEHAFWQLNEELLRSNHLISKDIIKILFGVLQNNLKQLKSVKIQLHQQLFNLYDMMITQAYIQDNGKISATFYKNVVSIGLELGKFEYVHKFMEEYKNKLIQSELAGDVYAYNKAKFFIYSGKLQNADELMENLHFKDALYKFALKSLLMMLFYEMKKFKLLKSWMNAFEVALSPNRPPHISEANTIVYRNFIHCLKKLHRFYIHTNATKSDVKQLVAFIKDTNQIANRKWVLMKAESWLSKMK